MGVDLSADPAAVLTALAAPMRWRIAVRLAAEELCVCHLVEDLGVAQPLVSHHLKVLREAGVVESERYKQWTYYRLVPEALTAVAAEVAGLSASVGAGSGRRPCC